MKLKDKIFLVPKFSIPYKVFSIVPIFQELFEEPSYA